MKCQPVTSENNKKNIMLGTICIKWQNYYRRCPEIATIIDHSLPMTPNPVFWKKCINLSSGELDQRVVKIKKLNAE